MTSYFVQSMFFKKAALPHPVPKTNTCSLLVEGFDSGVVKSSNIERVFSARKRG